MKLQKRAATVGFDWPEILQIIDKIHEETAEVVAEAARMPNEAVNRLTFIISGK